MEILNVGVGGLEPPVSEENGFTVRAATSYRLHSLKTLKSGLNHTIIHIN